MIERFASIGSTQREAIARARRGAPPGTTLVAAAQTEGIGRLDHRWASPAGGLYLSSIVEEPAAPFAWFPLALGVDLARALEALGAPRLGLRWPNDLVDPEDGAKFGGTLVDRIPVGEAVRWVVGVGLNVDIPAEAFPEELRRSAASLRARSARPIPLAAAERATLDALERAVARAGGAVADPGLLVELRGRLEGVGRPVWIDGRPAGRLRTVDEDGALVTERDGAEERHLAGSLSYRAPG